VGGIIGIVFYLLQQMTGHLAGLFNLVPSLTILTPVLILLLIATAAQFWRGTGKPGAQFFKSARKSPPPA
jgi:lipopolysaccharide export LptBFGC system permease protein LptF